MSVADEFDVYLFPHDLPVNLSNPSDLDRLRRVFAGRELYLAVGSDVVANASSYKAPPTPGSVQEMNHIVFRRVSIADGPETDADLHRIQGKLLELQLPTYLEDISSTRIRENIDLGRDISNLIDPVVQGYIYRNSLYLREPQYKRLLHASYLDFSVTEHPDDGLCAELSAAVPGSRDHPLRIDPLDSVMTLRDTEPGVRILGCLTMCLHFGEQGGCFYGGVMVQEVYPAIREADALVMLCPNYNDAVSANLTACINRLTALYRTTSFERKALYGIVVSGYSGGDIVAAQLVSSLCINKGFWLPPDFCLLETANDAGSALRLPGIEERLARFADGMLRHLKR